jgi:hypothetical protein
MKSVRIALDYAFAGDKDSFFCLATKEPKINFVEAPAFGNSQASLPAALT